MELQNMTLNIILQIITILCVSRLRTTDPLLTSCTIFLLFLHHVTFFLACMTTGLLHLFNDAVTSSEATASKVRRTGNFLE
jgi:hypothetical protein